jgi:DNA-binding CsgD family transcriptional regulator
MNNRWTREEESNLLKNIQSGKTYAELAGGFNRSENALEMRVKKIIYENITSGKTPSKISELLNISSDKIMQYYYSYKEHLEKENLKGGNAPNEKNSKISQLENLIPKQNGGNNINNVGIINNSDKLLKLKEQNEKLKLLLENYFLKDKLSKVMKNDKNIQNDILKALMNN